MKNKEIIEEKNNNWEELGRLLTEFQIPKDTRRFRILEIIERIEKQALSRQKEEFKKEIEKRIEEEFEKRGYAQEEMEVLEEIRKFPTIKKEDTWKEVPLNVVIESFNKIKSWQKKLCPKKKTTSGEK